MYQTMMISSKSQKHSTVTDTNKNSRLFMFVCLFMCLSFHQTRECFTHLGHYHYRSSAASFDDCFFTLCNWSEGFVSVPHLLLHIASVYNGHHRRQWWHALLFLRLWSVAAGIRTPMNMKINMLVDYMHITIWNIFPGPGSWEILDFSLKFNCS